MILGRRMGPVPKALMGYTRNRGTVPNCGCDMDTLLLHKLAEYIRALEGVLLFDGVFYTALRTLSSWPCVRSKHCEAPSSILSRPLNLFPSPSPFSSQATGPLLMTSVIRIRCASLAALSFRHSVSSPWKPILAFPVQYVPSTDFEIIRDQLSRFIWQVWGWIQGL